MLAGQEGDDEIEGEGYRELLTLWAAFPLLVHEYIHTLEHPRSKRMNNRVILEGFCDMFAQDVTFAALESKDETFIKEVAGQFNTPPRFLDDIADGYVTVPDYEPYVAKAKEIREKVGDEAVKASYFLGKVEYIGLTSEGKLLKSS